MLVRTPSIAVIAVWALLLALASGCEKTDHESIDKWAHTSKGPAKLQHAIVDETITADLSAHAAAVLIKRGDDQPVYTAFETMPPGRRAEIIAQLAPRLWEIARVENERDLPGAPQVAAKDALVRLHRWADAPTRQTIDKYLIDWYCVASYEDRAKAGASLGASVLRIVGPAAAPKLIAVANGVIAAPGQAGQNKLRNKVGDELLLGLAATGSPEAVAYILDVARMDRGDPTLPRRSISALYKAYVAPDGLFDLVDPEAIAANLPAIVDVAKDDTRGPEIANDTVSLIRAVGPPRCLPPLLALVGAPHQNPSEWKIVVATNALICGGTVAIADAIRALPDTGTYAEDQIVGLARAISRMSPRDRAVAGATALLDERGVVARWVGIEALGALKASEAAPRIAQLASSRDRLNGYAGERSQGKDDPTLGQRAREISAALAGK